MTDLEQALKHWQTMAQLQVKFVEALGQYKVDVARAELTDAVAAGEWEVARMKAQVVKELEASLRRLNRQRTTTARRVARLDRQVRNLAKIRGGEDVTATQLTLLWAAYRVFERSVPAETLEKILNTPLHDESRQGCSYVDPHLPQRPCPNPPDSVDNVHALIAWLQQHRFLPRRGTAAYRQVMAALTTFGDYAASEVAALEQSLRDIEQGTYSTWQPVMIAGLPDTVDAKKIVRLGTK
jgi:hypothetical protein